MRRARSCSSSDMPSSPMVGAASPASCNFQVTRRCRGAARRQPCNRTVSVRPIDVRDVARSREVGDTKSGRTHKAGLSAESQRAHVSRTQAATHSAGVTGAHTLLWSLRPRSACACGANLNRPFKIAVSTGRASLQPPARDGPSSPRAAAPRHNRINMQAACCTKVVASARAQSTCFRAVAV